MFNRNIKTGIYLDFQNYWVVVYKGVKFGDYPFRQLDKAQRKLNTLVVEDESNNTQINNVQINGK